ncbi:MAG: magnesium transporter, partial [Chloroflexi bacterium]|nr:magnesium transporter [Chloroflexota bacterium]
MDPSQIELALARIRTALEAGEVQAAIDSLTDLHPVDRADAFSDLDQKDQAALLPRLDLEATADLLEQLEDEQAAAVAETFDSEQLADVLDEMEPDEAADVLGDLPAKRAEEALAEMEEAGNVLPLLHFADKTAGGLMTTSFIAVPKGTTALEAIEVLRRVEPSPGTPYYLYVEDEAARLVGILGLRELVIATPDTRIETIMEPEV